MTKDIEIFKYEKVTDKSKKSFIISRKKFGWGIINELLWIMILSFSFVVYRNAPLYWNYIAFIPMFMGFEYVFIKERDEKIEDLKLQIKELVKSGK